MLQMSAQQRQQSRSMRPLALDVNGEPAGMRYLHLLRLNWDRIFVYMPVGSKGSYLLVHRSLCRVRDISFRTFYNLARGYKREAEVPPSSDEEDEASGDGTAAPGYKRPAGASSSSDASVEGSCDAMVKRWRS